MQRKLITSSLLLGLAVGLISIAGCGKNVVGPTAPEVVHSAATMQAASGTEAVASGDQITAACNGKGFKLITKKIKEKWNWRGYVQSFLPGFYRHILNETFGGFITFEKPLLHAVSNRLFMKIVLQFGIDRLIAEKVFGVLALGWAPGEGTNPGGFSIESTLLPKAWNPGQGFYGELKPGWETHINSVVGYEFNATNDEGAILKVMTGSLPVNLYDNQGEIYMFDWAFGYREELPVRRGAEVSIRADDLSPSRFLFSGLVINLEDNGIGLTLDVSLSKIDKAATYVIDSPNLQVQIIFQPDGAGTGRVKILNSMGVFDVYEYTVFADGKGYYTKNGGRKIWFRL